MDLSIFEFIFEIAKILCKKNSTKLEFFRFLSRSIVSLFTFSTGKKKKKFCIFPDQVFSIPISSFFKKNSIKNPQRRLKISCTRNEEKGRARRYLKTGWIDRIKNCNLDLFFKSNNNKASSI